MDSMITLKQIIQAVLLRRKKWIALATLAAMVAFLPAAYLLSKEPPRYRTGATILVESRPEKTPIFQEYAPFRPIAVQMAILRSRSLAEAVIDTMPRASVDDLTENPYDRDFALEFQNWLRKLRGEEPVVESPQRRALAELQRARVRFTPGGSDTGIVSISAEATKPRVALDIANTYIEVLISRTRSFNVDDTRATREFLEQQYSQLGQAVATSEEAFRQFNLARGGVKVPVRNAETVNRISQLEQAMAEVQANKNMSQSRLSAFKSKLAALPATKIVAPEPSATSPSPSPSAPPSARVQRLRAKLSSLESQLLELETRYTDQHPRVTLTRQQIGEVQSELSEAVKEQSPVAATAAAARDVPAQDRMAFAETVSSLEASVQSLGAQEDAIKGQLGNLRKNLSGLSRDELEFARLATDLESNRRLRDMVTERLAAVRIREQGEMKVVKVIDPPSVPQPAANEKRIKFLAVAAVLALAIGLGVPTAIEYVNRPVESEHDVRQITGLPVLSIVPSLRTRRTLGPARGLEDSKHEDVFLFTEAFRRLRVELQLLGRETELRRILVASALPGEGKSTVVVNLGHAFGEVGKHVILADADFQRPTLHRTLKSPGGKGFSDVLAGTSDLQESLNQVGDGVWLMPRGGSPSALTRTGLGSGRLAEVLTQLASEAEYVILDSSPILLVPDNLYVAAAADGILLVVHAGTIRPRELLRAKEILDKSGTPIIGVVLNQMPLRRLEQYYGYYNKYYKTYAKAEATRS
jgi:succinoglycan biosynthesis transport protein ExoP